MHQGWHIWWRVNACSKRLDLGEMTIKILRTAMFYIGCQKGVRRSAVEDGNDQMKHALDPHCTKRRIAQPSNPQRLCAMLVIASTRARPLSKFQVGDAAASAYIIV